MHGGKARQTKHDRQRRAGGPATADKARRGYVMAYQVYTRSGAGAFGIIVETVREALTKAY